MREGGGAEGAVEREEVGGAAEDVFVFVDWRAGFPGFRGGGEVEWDAVVDGEVGERGAGLLGDVGEDGGPEGGEEVRGGVGEEGGPGEGGEAAAGEENHGFVDDPAFGGGGEEGGCGVVGAEDKFEERGRQGEDP